jgi:hypothetical protein
MKKFLCGLVLLASAILIPAPTMAGVNINIGISLPPPIGFQAPPEVVVLPDTNDVYAVPDINAELFFWNGWWWRLWEGRWYRSHYYSRGWAYYNSVPSFYFDVDPEWRTYYRDHAWRGRRWDYERIPDRQLRRNWRSWHNSRHWERQRTWGVQNYQPRPQRQIQEQRNQRQQQYQRRPEVQRNQQQIREQQRRPEVQRNNQQIREQQRQPRVRQAPGQQPQRQQPQPRAQQRREESQHQKSQKKSESRDSEHGR